MWFYKFEHDSKAKKVRIIWNTKVTYTKNILGFCGLTACFLNSIWIAGICLSALAILLGYYLYRYGDLVQALRKSEKDEKLEYEGSRYSFKNPLIVSIPAARLS